jgi:integrase
LIKLLRQHQEEQERERIAAGAEWEAKGYVFASPTGGPLSPNTGHHVWKRLLRDVGVRDGRLHDARHTAATVLDGTDRDGRALHVERTATDVARRGSDGRWRYVIDNPFGTRSQRLATEDAVEPTS